MKESNSRSTHSLHKQFIASRKLLWSNSIKRFWWASPSSPSSSLPPLSYCEKKKQKSDGLRQIPTALSIRYPIDQGENLKHRNRARSHTFRGSLTNVGPYLHLPTHPLASRFDFLWSVDYRLPELLVLHPLVVVLLLYLAPGCLASSHAKSIKVAF